MMKKKPDAELDLGCGMMKRPKVELCQGSMMA